MSDPITTGEEIKLVIDGLTLVVAAAVGFFGYRKFGIEKKKDRQAKAREKFGEYLQDARQNLPFMMEFWPPKAGTKKERITAYQLFVARVMWACEEAVVAFDSDDWKACINEQLEYHRAYFSTPRFHEHMRTLHPKLVTHLHTYGFV